jgi:hypothetical protein
LLLILSIGLLVYGLVNPPASNLADLKARYGCGRITADYRDTDQYCGDIGSSPEAETNYWNAFVIAGLTSAALGVVLVKSSKLVR